MESEEALWKNWEMVRVGAAFGEELPFFFFLGRGAITVGGKERKKLGQKKSLRTREKVDWWIRSST